MSDLTERLRRFVGRADRSDFDYGEVGELCRALPALLDAVEERDRLRRVLFGPSFETGAEFDAEVEALRQIAGAALKEAGDE